MWYNLVNTLKKQKNEKDNQQNLEKRQIIDRYAVWGKETCAIVGDSVKWDKWKTNFENTSGQSKILSRSSH